MDRKRFVPLVVLSSLVAIGACYLVKIFGLDPAWIGIIVGTIIVLWGIGYRVTSASVSVAILIEEGNRLILVEQAPWVGGKWGPPAGHLRLGETVTEAALREAREETGLEVVLVDLVGVYTTPYTAPQGLSHLRIGFVFRARMTVKSALRPMGHEVARVRWFTREEVKALGIDQLYKPEYNQRCLADWLSYQSYPLSIISEKAL